MAASESSGVTVTGGLCCVGYSVNKDEITTMCTAGFSFASGDRHYIATSLHGEHSAHELQVPWRGQALLADAFWTKDSELKSGGEVGAVVCDWLNDYVDVALIQKDDRDEPAAEWYSEEQVVEYMVQLVKATFQHDWTPVPVLVHTAVCFRGVAGAGPIPATLMSIGNFLPSDSTYYHWHFLVRFDSGYEVVHGQDGSAVTLASDGRPIGMLVRRLKDKPSVALVTPLHHIYASLNSVLPADQKLRLCRQCPVTVVASHHVGKFIAYKNVLCIKTGQPYQLSLAPSGDRPLQACCQEHTELVNYRVEQLIYSPLSVVPSRLPASCQFWSDTPSSSYEPSTVRSPLASSTTPSSRQPYHSQTSGVDDIAQRTKAASREAQSSSQGTISLVPAPNPPQHRIALCIGNAAYPAAPLATPVNDATDFAHYLRERLGFTAAVICDGSKHDMEDALERLLAAIQPGTVVALFFAGHACEASGVNYLLPVVNCSAMSDADLRNQGVSAQWMQAKVLERKPAVVLFILDACRYNPFRGTRSLGGGLAAMEPLGSLLLFACAPGRVALDGIGSRNSPLTTQLMQHLHVGEVHSAIRRVINAVYESTGGKRQQPWQHSDMKNDFYWNAPEASAAPKLQPPASSSYPTRDGVFSIDTRGFTGLLSASSSSSHHSANPHSSAAKDRSVVQQQPKPNSVPTPPWARFESVPDYSDAAWYAVASLLQPNPGWSSAVKSVWADPQLVYAWSVEPSCPKAWQRVLRERPLNVDLIDLELKSKLSAPWQYFVLFVSVDVDSAPPHKKLKLARSIKSKLCAGKQLRWLFHADLIQHALERDLDRVVVVLTDAVEAEDLTSTALCCVSYSLTHQAPNVTTVTTAGFSFAAGDRHYVATSLHGAINARRQHIPSKECAVILADAFRTDDETLAGAGEVGAVLCDWRNQYVDVGLIQLHDEHKSAAVCYTEAQVVAYMVILIKAVYSVDESAVRVLVHPASCFTGSTDPDRIPGTLVRVWHVGKPGSSNTREWHLLVQLDAGYEVRKGQSGSAVTLEADGTPVGMLVANIKGDSTKALVTPLHHIYASLNSVLPTDQKLHLCACHQCPVTVAASQRATKLMTNAQVHCAVCSKPLRLQAAVNGEVLDGCCGGQRELAVERLSQRLHNPLSSSLVPTDVPVSCVFWK